MIVDPETGIPIDTGATSTFGQDVVQNALANAEMQDSKLFSAAEYMPGISESVGWNAWRGERTITKGLKGWRLGAKPYGSGVASGGIQGTFHPSNFSRMPTVDMLDPVDRKGARAYSPFNVLSGKHRNAGSAKKISKQVAARSKGATSPKLDKMVSRGILSPKEIDAIGEGATAPDMYGGGAIARLSASSRIVGFDGGYNTIASGKKAVNAVKFIGQTDKALLGGLQQTFGVGMGEMTSAELGDAIASSVRGRRTQFFTGYMRGARGLGTRTPEVMANAGTKNAFMGGAKMAERHLGDMGIEAVGGRLSAKAGSELAKRGVKNVGLRSLGKVYSAKVGEQIALGVGETAAKKAAMWGTAKAGLAMGAGAIGPFIPGLNVAMAVWTAYDITKMGIELLKGGGATAVDAYKSVQGSLYKPAMGMGYRDTEVAATSRARGVMAIQNSRLNARSVLGNEAAGLYSHFG